MTETNEIITGAVAELELREEKLQQEIDEVQVSKKAELKDVQKALRALRKQLGESPNGDGEQNDAPPQEITNEVKDAVLRELAEREKEGKGSRATDIAGEADLPVPTVKAALAELEESGDVEHTGRGIYRGGA